MESLLVVPTFQRTKNDLVGIGVDVDTEKDDCLERFALMANAVCDTLSAAGHWTDYTDPCSGFPARGERGLSIYPDVLGAQMFLKYDVLSANCCSILAHPAFGTKVYPATLFTTAPQEALHAALRAQFPGLPPLSPEQDA